MIARNDDSGSGHYTPKKFAVVQPSEQPRHYKSVLSHVEIDLPDDPMRYTCVPNVLEGEGIWAAAGVNAAEVAMTATETITSNERVLGADPLVEYVPAEKSADSREHAGGIGEEDIVVLTLPYIHSAREGVQRLGSILEQYGTYEMNGIAFADVNEIWWLETIGGHHWIARRVPDDAYVMMPNQLGIDVFDLDDAFGAQKEYMCSADLKEFIEKNHLDLSLDGILDPRAAFGSHDDADHVYNTPRAWFIGRYFNRHTYSWDGPDAYFTPESDDIPWCLVPERKITPEDVKYVLSSHFQGTPYDPYASYGPEKWRGAYRSIGVNRTDFLAMMQIRPDMPVGCRAVEWLCFASNAFNTWIPLYTNINNVPEYLSSTGEHVSTDNFYWNSRLIAALADAGYRTCLNHIEHYQLAVQSKGHENLDKYDPLLKTAAEKVASGDAETGNAASIGDEVTALCEKANQEITDELRACGEKTLDKLVFEVSNLMKNSYSRSDA
jgi:dipeptidase